MAVLSGPFTSLSSLFPVSHARRVVTAVTQWPVESQLAARRNAMVAATALAQRRAEREEVEEFLAALSAPAHSSPAAVAPAVSR